MEVIMRFTLQTCATVVLVTAAGCTATPPPQPTTDAHQAIAPVTQAQGWAALVEADREVNALEAQREAIRDPFVADALTHQIEAIVSRSDALMDEMTAGDGRSHDVQIRRLTSVLQHDMGTGVAAEMQGPERPAPSK